MLHLHLFPIFVLKILIVIFIIIFGFILINQINLPAPVKQIEKIAIKLSAKSFFPFEAPFQPFVDWAKKCSTMGSSPGRLLVHKEKGLFISFRGTLGINEYIESPNNSKDICTPCEKPCLTACPVSALNQDGYDVIRCKEYLNTPNGQECRDGCLVRRSCPSGQNLRLKEQSNFHMRAFLSD